jgi:hypothetical protein
MTSPLNEKLTVSEPPASADVNAKDRPGASPEEILPTTALDDVHVVLAAALPPTRDSALASPLPMLLPKTVTDAAPVLGPLAATALEASNAMKEKEATRLPEEMLVVEVVVRAAQTPDDTLQATADDDVHMVATAPDAPTRELPLYPDAPMPEPSSVTLAAPEATPLAETTLLGTTVSDVIADASEEDMTPAVTLTRRLLPTAALDLQANADDEIQAVAEVELPLTRTPAL